MKKNLFSSLLIAALITTGISAWAQCKTPVPPTDPATRQKADEYMAIYGDAIKEGNYKVAKSPLLWLINNAPQYTSKLYIDAVDMYDKLATAEPDAAKKQVLVDSMLLMFDLRVKSCGEEASVLNRKANASFKFNYKNKEKLPGLLESFDKVFELNGNNVSDGTLGTYMNLVDLNAKYAKNLNVDQVLQRYDKVVSVIDAKTKVAQEKNQAPQIEKLKGIKTQVDDSMVKTITGLGGVTCDFVKKNMEPKWRQTKDLDMAKKMFVFMTKDNCTEDPLWLELADFKIDNGEKDFALLKNVAIKHISNGKMDRGEELIKMASAAAKEPKEKGDVFEIMGGLEVKRGNKVAARELYMKANAADPSNLDALSKVATLYMNSFDDCKKLKSKAEDRLIYLAAFDMYARAKDNQGMGRAKAQFPGKDEIFDLNWKVGDVKNIDCWVGGSVSIRTRD